MLRKLTMPDQTSKPHSCQNISQLVVYSTRRHFENRKKTWEQVSQFPDSRNSILCSPPDKTTLSNPLWLPALPRVVETNDWCITAHVQLASQSRRERFK